MNSPASYGLGMSEASLDSTTVLRGAGDEMLRRVETRGRKAKGIEKVDEVGGALGAVVAGASCASRRKE